MMGSARSTIHVARSVPDALALLESCGPDGEILAGATWIMRAPLRGETGPRRYIAVSRIPELRDVVLFDHDLRIGSCATHTALAEAVLDVPSFAGLHTAAETSANPQVRSVATVGGNLCTRDFPAADLATALLCLDASIHIQTSDGTAVVPIAAFLGTRGALRGSGLVTLVVVPRSDLRTAHVRLPLRKAGDYPVAIVSVAALLRADGTLGEVRVAVGSVEPVPRRWLTLEQRLEGVPLDPEAIAATATHLTHDFVGRDSVEAPGWYRTKVLPALVRRAFAALGSP